MVATAVEGARQRAASRRSRKDEESNGRADRLGAGGRAGEGRDRERALVRFRLHGGVRALWPVAAGAWQCAAVYRAGARGGLSGTGPVGAVGAAAVEYCLAALRG